MKAMIVIDIPDDYEEYGSGLWYVVGDDLKIVYEKDGNLMTYKYIDDDMARIEPLPEKLDWYDNGFSYCMGWNECLDEILGEDK